MLPTKEEMLLACEKKHGEVLQKKFQDACVAICGLGGLGSNIAMMLAKAGVGKLILIDFDRVDITNLQRQMYEADQVGRYKAEALEENLKKVQPYLTYESHVTKVTPENAMELLKGADVVCEAFDRAEEKAMLADLVLSKFPQTYLVSGSGMTGFGPANQIRTRKVTGHFYLCGDEVSDVDALASVFSARVTLCAAHQAQAVLRIIGDCSPVEE